MHMTRYNNPWDFINQLQREIYNPAESDADLSKSHDWTPAVDVHETEKAYTLLVDVPGVDPKDIDVSMEKNVLAIKGERNSETSSESEGVKRVERQYGSFARYFTLPDTADDENIEANANNGVLTITIPKQTVAVSRRIDVKH